MAKSRTAGWASDAPTPAQLSELFRQIGSGRVTKQKLQSFLRDDTPPKSYEPARKILDDDFISPEEVAQARGVSYTAEQLKQLADTLPPAEVLQWCKDNGYALVAGPSTEMSLLDVRSANSFLFYSKEEGWYANQPFAANDKVGCRWLAICKTEVPNSLNENWDEQRSLLQECEEVPNAAQMSWFITTYYEVRGVRLFGNVWVRTSSVRSGGDRVGVGDFDEDGLLVGYCWDGSDYVLGVAASRKF